MIADHELFFRPPPVSELVVRSHERASRESRAQNAGAGSQRSTGRKLKRRWDGSGANPTLPGQLLTGMYGMNFQQKDGEPGIPELMFAYPWGYVWFWCCFLTCSLSMVAYFKYYRRWI